MTIAEQKKLLRRSMREVRKQISSNEETQRGLQEKVIDAVLDLVSLKRTVAAFSPIQTEPDILSLLQEIASLQKLTLTLPRIEGHTQPLSFRRYDANTALVQHPQLRVMEPPDSAETLIPNLVLVPLLAVDTEGYRLGYGGGYYDRTLQVLHDQHGTIALGVGYDCQRVRKPLPRDPHDRPLDYLVTESGLYDFRQRGISR